MIITAASTGIASGGVTYKFGALCFYSNVVLVDSFELKNPPERKSSDFLWKAFLGHKTTNEKM